MHVQNTLFYHSFSIEIVTIPNVLSSATMQPLCWRTTKLSTKQNVETFFFLLLTFFIHTFYRIIMRDYRFYDPITTDLFKPCSQVQKIEALDCVHIAHIQEEYVFGVSPRHIVSNRIEVFMRMYLYSSSQATFGHYAFECNQTQMIQCDSYWCIR